MILEYIWFVVSSLVFALCQYCSFLAIDGNKGTEAALQPLAMASAVATVWISWTFITEPLFAHLQNWLPETGTSINSFTAGFICFAAWVIYGATLISLTTALDWLRRNHFPFVP